MGRMDMPSRGQYLKVLINQYLKAKRKAKGLLLDEYCRNTGHNRKYVIRKIRQLACKRQKRRRKRKATYGYDVRDVLSEIWKIFDYPCGQRLKPIFMVELERLRKIGELKISDKVTEKLTSISSATIDRILRPVKEKWRYERKSSHKRSGNLLYKRIPLKLTDWDALEVGYIEMDLVCHCGSSRHLSRELCLFKCTCQDLI